MEQLHYFFSIHVVVHLSSSVSSVSSSLSKQHHSTNIWKPLSSHFTIVCFLVPLLTFVLAHKSMQKQDSFQKCSNNTQTWQSVISDRLGSSFLEQVKIREIHEDKSSSTLDNETSSNLQKTTCRTKALQWYGTELVTWAGVTRAAK